jgi:hypothetical protein
VEHELLYEPNPAAISRSAAAVIGLCRFTETRGVTPRK